MGMHPTDVSSMFPEQEQERLSCPRCDSTNTKFCYYNNYNLSQPRYFCKNCRRYWTKGGTLRNIPIGGATRKRTSIPNKLTSRPPQPEPSHVYGFGSHQMESGFSSLLGSHSMGFLMDGSSSNVAGKSNDDVLIRNPIAVDYLLRLKDNSNDKGGRGESGYCWIGGENGCSRFH